MTTPVEMRTPIPRPACRVAAVALAYAATLAARRSWRRALTVALACWLALAPLLVPAQDATRTATPQGVKAAYLFKFPAYVDWPEARFAQPDSPLTVAVVGADDVAEALAELTAGRTVNGRSVIVRRQRIGDPLTGAHVVFFSGAARERAEQIAAEAAAQSVLTVTDVPAAAQHSIIEFVTTGGKVRFEVRLPAAERSGLRLHAGLLNVAARVHGARR